MNIGARQINKPNLLNFFQLRPNGVTPDLIEDMQGLDSPMAQRLIKELAAEGSIELRAGRWFSAERSVR